MKSHVGVMLLMLAGVPGAQYSLWSYCLQALTVQQQALNQQVQDMARTLERLEAGGLHSNSNSTAAAHEGNSADAPTWQSAWRQQVPLPAAILVAAAAVSAAFLAVRLSK